MVGGQHTDVSGYSHQDFYHLGHFPVRCLACVMPRDVTLYGAIKGAAYPNLVHHQFCKISHSHAPTKIYIRRHFMSFLRKWIPIRNVLHICIVSICGWMDLIIDSVTGKGGWCRPRRRHVIKLYLRYIPHASYVSCDENKHKDQWTGGCFGRVVMAVWVCSVAHYTVIPRLTKIIRSGITFVSRNLR